MSKKRPGTVSPTDHIVSKISERLVNIGKNKEKDPNRKTGSKFGKRSSVRTDPRPKLHRKGGRIRKIKEDNNMNMVDTIKFLIENHKRMDVFRKFENKTMLKTAAKKCMATCLNGWQKSKDGLVSENTDMVLSEDSWKILDDGSAALKSGFQFDYDWLYYIANSDVIKEDKSGLNISVLDADMFADTLTNAASILRKLSDKEVKKYILNAARNDESTDVLNLKEILEETGINWQFVGAEIDDDIINLLIKVKYSKDGTQDGVIEKKLSIEVKPSADVVEKQEITEPDELDLSFDRSKFSDDESSDEISDETPEISDESSEEI